MKIAKKVLAVAMAVAMIACFAAVAFAAPTATSAYKLTLIDASDAGYTYGVVFSLEDSIDFAAGGATIKYDPAVLVYAEDAAEGEDAAAMKKLIKSSNTFTYEINGNEEGTLVFGFYFKESLWTTEKFLAEKKNNSKEEDVKAIDVNSFDAVVFYFDLADGAKEEDIEVSLVVDNANFLGADGEKVPYADMKATGIEKAAEETTAAPETTTAAPETTTAAPETTTEEAPSTPDEVTTAKGETDKGPATGDTGVLAIAAGVVALAGAAFVVSKKRK